MTGIVWEKFLGGIFWEELFESNCLGGNFLTIRNIDKQILTCGYLWSIMIYLSLRAPEMQKNKLGYLRTITLRGLSEIYL